MSGVLGIVPVRGGQLPAGAADVTAAAGGRVILVGEQTAAAGRELPWAREVYHAETDEYRPAAVAAALADVVRGEPMLVLPAGPDGRDLAPRLAAALRRPLLANAVSATPERVICARYGDRVAEEAVPAGPVVVTLVPGRAAAPPPGTAGRRSDHVLRLVLPDAHDADVLGVMPPDPATVHLSEAQRIVAGGLGVGSEEGFELLADLASRLGAAVGGTRVAADLGWIPFERQIGTTGVTVDPELYVAFGISGAVQHTSGLGTPRHVVSVNTDESAPMMARANLAVVTDAIAVIREMLDLLSGMRSEGPAVAEFAGVADG